MLSSRFLVLPAIALAAIVALSKAHSGSRDAATQTVYRAVNCAAEPADAACAVAETGAVTALH